MHRLILDVVGHDITQALADVGASTTMVQRSNTWAVTRQTLHNLMGPRKCKSTFEYVQLIIASTQGLYYGDNLPDTYTADRFVIALSVAVLRL